MSEVNSQQPIERKDSSKDVDSNGSGLSLGQSASGLNSTPVMPTRPDKMPELKSQKPIERKDPAKAAVNSNVSETLQTDDSQAVVGNENAIRGEELESTSPINAPQTSLDRNVSLMTLLEPDSTLAVKQHKAEVIQSHLNFLFKDQKLCDLVIKNDETRYNVHSFALTMHSEKYKAIFTDPYVSPPKEIALYAVSGEAIDRVLEYMYTFSVELNDEGVDGILDVAKQLDMKMLIKKCVEYLLKFDAGNVLMFLAICKKHHFKSLTAKYLGFAKQNFHQISKLPEFYDLSFDDLKTMLVSEENASLANDNTTEKLKSAVEWVTKDMDSRSVQLARLLEILSLDRVQPEALEGIIESAQFITSIPECLQILRKAFRFHAMSVARDSKRASSPAVTESSQPKVLDPCLVVIGGLVDKSGCPYGKGTTVLRCSLGDDSGLKQWTNCNPLPSRRCGHCALVLNNHIYVLGGSIHEGELLLPLPTRTAVRYNPALSKWEQLPSMTVARNELAACAAEGLIYVFGGETEEFSPTDTVECFCPLTNRWTLMCPMAVGRTSHAACLHRNLIFVVGGRVENTILQFVDVYDFSEDRWLPQGYFPTRICHGSLIDLDELLFYVGGVSLQDEGVFASSEKIYEYDDDVAQWKVVGRLALPRHLAASAALGHRIYVIGGFSTSTWSSTSKVSIFDTEEHSCVDGIPDLPDPLMNMAAVTTNL